MLKVRMNFLKNIRKLLLINNRDIDNRDIDNCDIDNRDINNKINFNL